MVDEADELMVVGQGLNDLDLLLPGGGGQGGQHLGEVRIEMGLLGHHYYSN